MQMFKSNKLKRLKLIFFQRKLPQIRETHQWNTIVMEIEMTNRKDKSEACSTQFGSAFKIVIFLHYFILNLVSLLFLPVVFIQKQLEVTKQHSYTWLQSWFLDY